MKLLAVALCVLTVCPFALGQQADANAALKKALQADEARTRGEIERWRAIRRQVATRTIDAKPHWLAAADNVIGALGAEIKAREALYAQDLAVVQAGGKAAQAIYLPRPYNDLGAETRYADRMIGLLSPRVKADPAELERMRGLAKRWKAADGGAEQAGRIDDWLKALETETALRAEALELYRQRAVPGWYDRACLVAKYDLSTLEIRERAARSAIKPAANQALLDAQIRAALAVHAAGKATYQAMTDFHEMTTRESPPAEPNAVPTGDVPEPLWDMKALSQPPACRWLDDNSPVRQVLYRGPVYQGKATDVFAYYATPGTLAGDANLDLKSPAPAVVLVHGGGDRAFRDWVTYWAKHGYAAIAMDLAGCGPNAAGEYDKLFKPERLLLGGPGQDGRRKILDANLPATDQWPYHAVANVVLAHSLVRNLPGVDANRTAVAGISWGGYLTCIVAGVDGRFRAAMPFYGCGFLAESSVWKDMGLFAELSPEARERWTSLWDPSVYAPQIAMPVFAVTGAKDFAYPLESFTRTYALTKGPKLFRITEDMGHGAQFLTSTPEALAFLDSVLRGGPALPAVGEAKLTADGAEASVAGEGLTSAEFHYTTAAGPNKTREWKTVAAEIKPGRLVAPRPPTEMKIGYFTVTDRRKLTTSSQPVVPSQ